MYDCGIGPHLRFFAIVAAITANTSGQSQPGWAGSQQVHACTAGRLDPAAEPSLEHRYYVCSNAGRIPISGRLMDWFSRFVLSWELSSTMETRFCLAALDSAFRFGQPEIWNSDQGSQFTAA